MRPPTARWIPPREPAFVAALALLVGLAAALAPSSADAQRRRRHRAPSSSGRSSGGNSGSSDASPSGSPTTAAPSSRPRRTRPPARPARRTRRAAPPATTAATATAGASAPVLDTERPPAVVSAASTSGSAEVPPPPPPGDAPPPPPARPVVRPAALDVQVGGRIFARHLSYSGDVRASYMAYDLDAGPAIAGAAEWYPGAHFSAGPAGWFGLIGSAEFAVGLSSRDPQGRPFATTAYALTGGLRFRVPIGLHDLGLFAAYGAQVYALGGGAAGASGVPSVAYQFIRVGGSFRIALGDRVAILVQAAYLGVLASGEFGSAMYFPHSSNGGFDVGLGLAVRLIAGFELRLTADYRRYFFSMRPAAGETFPAGGAADQYFGATLSAAYRF